MQTPNVTKAKLMKEGITLELLPAYEPKELCHILGVDAIIMGTFQTNKPMSQGGAIAISVLFGVGGSTEKAVLNMSIYEGKEGELMCSYMKKPEWWLRIVFRGLNKRVDAKGFATNCLYQRHLIDKSDSLTLIYYLYNQQ